MSKIVIFILCVLFSGFHSSAYAINYALLFDGTDDYVKVPDSNALDLSTGMTIEAWIKSGTTNGPRVIASKWNDISGEWSYIFKDHNNGDKLRIELSKGGHNDLANLQGNTSIVTGNWLHVAATYDSNFVKLYYNGFEDGSQSAPGSIHNSLTDLLIGAVNFGAINPIGLESFSGVIDEVRIWNYARTAQELQNWMYASLSGSESGLVGYWNFDEGSGQLAHDVSLYANNGQLGSNMGSDNNDPMWIVSDSPVSAPVPEPATLSLLGLGLLGLVFRRKKR